MEFVSGANTELLILIAGFLVVAVAANQIAGIFQRINLPIITGLLVVGIITGPFVLNLIPEVSAQKLNFINELALAFIAFAAGAELYLRELRSRINSIKWITIGQLVVTFIMSAGFVYLAQDYVPFMRGMSFETKLAISILTGTIFVARSPASAIAVINELRAKGPFTQTVMGVTVLKDFLVILLFAISLAISKVLVNGSDFDIMSIVVILLGLLVGAGLGFGLGRLLEMMLVLRVHQLIKTVCIIILGYLVYVLTHYLEGVAYTMWGLEILLEPLLICIIASLYVTNYTKYRPEFLKILSETGPHVYVAFFTLTGASLSINILIGIWPVAVLLFLIRLVSVVVGAYFGGIMAREPMRLNHIGWMPYVTQAGVALGLATIVANEFPDWGGAFATVIVAIIVINQFVGPPLFKWALFKAGEDRSRASFKYDGIRDAIIFGYENQSVALAKQLSEQGWKVQIASVMKEGSFEAPDNLDIKYLQSINLDEIKALGAANTEAIVCMMSDKQNYEICELAYQHFGTPDIIVRLNDRTYYQELLALGVRVVDPSTAMVTLLDHFVRSPQATSLLLGLEHGQDTRDVEVVNTNLHGIALRNLRLPADVIIISIRRAGQQIISHGYTRMRVGDVVTFVGSVKSLDELTLRFE